MNSLFQVIDERGSPTIGDRDEARPVRPGDVVLVPARTWHSIRAEGGPMRYLAVDCFLSDRAKLEPTWAEHARAMCRERGWDDEAAVRALPEGGPRAPSRGQASRRSATPTSPRCQ